MHGKVGTQGKEWGKISKKVGQLWRFVGRYSWSIT